MKRIIRIMSVMLLCAFIGCGSGVPCGPSFPQGCPPWMVCTISAGQFTCERSTAPTQNEITTQKNTLDDAATR